MEKKEPRGKILWVRISDASHDAILKDMKESGYKSKSEFVDRLIRAIYKLGKNDRKSG